MRKIKFFICKVLSLPGARQIGAVQDKIASLMDKIQYWETHNFLDKKGMARHTFAHLERIYVDLEKLKGPQK